MNSQHTPLDYELSKEYRRQRQEQAEHMRLVAETKKTPVQKSVNIVHIIGQMIVRMV